jgi:hypothetical protein
MALAANSMIFSCRANRGVEGLPPNWEHVVLDKKMIVKLHNLGIEYRQERLRNVRGMDE